MIMTIHIIPFLGDKGKTTFVPIFLLLLTFKKMRIEVVQKKNDVNFCAQYLRYLMLQERMIEETKKQTNNKKIPITFVL